MELCQRFFRVTAGVSRTRLANELRVGRTTLYKWEMGHRVPCRAHQEKMQRYLREIRRRQA